ncbi:aminotransferase class I/II-fold pyridoxal phosphate-dependent enzyme [Desertivirga arenae]|uniref:aminotransferase class I/II-fold pyridoxal phosphate-dependent enzyme n=1 Tax=Desertivirga arenae TaxID=2810309 RepID=UPI001A956F1F|nr:aminotransferase class I/II-fold pyridoxal phosphate-dependent enzyme [Pedobacter sp. SYSU D00823]
MSIDFYSASFKDFEDVPGLNVYERSAYFTQFLSYLKSQDRLNYRLLSSSPCSPEMDVHVEGSSKPRRMVSFVSNDYLGFSQHPKVKEAVIKGVEKFGAGSGASPAIGGHFSYHQILEDKIAAFFKRKDAILYTTGYTANSASLMSLLRKQDIAILDMAVHASMYEGCAYTNVKTFPHNNLDALERILQNTKGTYRTRAVVIDGVYSQNGDLAPIKQIVELTKAYKAFLIVDDAHGTGVLGKTGRGLIEVYNLFQEIDMITGTFSKTFGNIGGYVIAKPEIINYLKYQSRQHLFSVTATPAVHGIIRAIDLIDEEPQWMNRLWNNIDYLKKGLLDLGFNIGNTQSAIIPVKIGDPVLNAESARILLNAGIYVNPIMYPAVSRKDARIRLSVMATHTTEQLDKALNAFQKVKTIIH